MEHFGNVFPAENICYLHSKAVRKVRNSSFTDSDFCGRKYFFSRNLALKCGVRLIYRCGLYTGKYGKYDCP